MNDLIMGIAFMAASYAVGSIPVGIIVSKLWGDVDPREHGSGSMGTTNVLRTVGKKAAATVLILDFAKGALAVGLPLILTPNSYWIHACCGVMAIIGHTWPVFAGFKGGKGVATGWAAIFVLSPWAGAVTLIGIVIALLTRYVSLGSMIGAVLGITALIVIAVVDVKATSTLVIREPVEYLLFAILAGGMIITSHRENIKRLIRGEENQLDIQAAQD